MCYVVFVGVIKLIKQGNYCSFQVQLICACFFFLMVSRQSFAQTDSDSSSEIFKQALTAFRAGNYTNALSGFETARQRGMDSIALRYNLGVTYYQLGRYRQSTKIFRSILKVRKWKGLVNYNLGLIALKQEMKDDAVQHFRQALKSSDKKINTLATIMLQRLGRQLKGPWSGYFRSGIGYDDNAALIDGTEISGTSGKADSFVELFGRVQYRLTGNKRRGFRLEASTYAIKYNTLSDYDTYNAHINTSYAQKGQKWNNLISGDSGLYYIAGAPRYRTNFLYISGRRKWQGTWLQFRSKTIRYDDVDSSYDYLNGWRQQISAETNWQKNKWHFGAVYSLELNERQDYKSFTEFYSYSPTQNRISLFSTYGISPQWKLNSGIAYRRSDYKGTDTHVIGGTPETRTRHDNRWRMWMKISRRFANNWEFAGNFSYTDNRSNFVDTSYIRSIYAIGVSRKF